MAIRRLVAYLTYAIALCGIVPLFSWLPAAPRLFLVTCLLAGIWQSARSPWPIPSWLTNASVVPVVLFYALQVNTTNPAPPMASMLAVMLAVRLLGKKNSRHCLQIHALSLFCLAASSLFDLSSTFLLYLALMLFLVALALVLIAFHDHDSRLVLSLADLRRVLGAGILLPVASMPLIIFFFPLLPRTQIPMWNFGLQPAARQSGFTDQVEPGRGSAMSESGRLAFRAELPRQANQQLYWRGVVLNRLDGTIWRRDSSVPPEQIRYGASRFSQEIYLEPGLAGVLPGLDAPVNINTPRVQRTADGIFTTREVSNRRSHYRVQSMVSNGLLPVSGTIDRDFYLQLPDFLSTRLKGLADGIRRQEENDLNRLELLERHFQNGHYRYSLRDMPTGDQALESFLFDSRQGNCEFFAAAFALAARAAGLPARLVGGYLGGEYNGVGQYYLVREQMAHVWVEVFVEGKGWVRSDPSRFAENAGELWSASQRPGLLRRIRLMVDSLDHLWNRQVLSYDFASQVEIVTSVGQRFQTLSVDRALRSLIAPCSVLVVGVGVALLLKRRRFFPSVEERLLTGFYRRLEQDCGLTVARGREGLFELAQRSGSPRVREFVSRYAAVIYHDRRLTRVEVAVLRKLLAAGFGPSGPPRSNPRVFF